MTLIKRGIMLQSQRFVKIEELVNEKGIVNTKEMAVLLGVTEKTIRLDYEELEKRGRLVRVHGGAKSIKEKNYYNSRRKTNEGAYRASCRKRGYLQASRRNGDRWGLCFSRWRIKYCTIN